MPMYTWVCNKCGMTTDVLRSFKDYENIPEIDELGDDTECDHDWQRHIGAGQTLMRGANWGSGRKGHW